MIVLGFELGLEPISPEPFKTEVVVGADTGSLIIATVENERKATFGNHLEQKLGSHFS